MTLHKQWRFPGSIQRYVYMLRVCGQLPTDDELKTVNDGNDMWADNTKFALAV
jgi:hypothetical protein